MLNKVKNNFLTICIPTYNRAKEIILLLDSIPKNNHIELVICDDGSTDNTKEIVFKYIDKLNINYIYQQNAGRSVALKKAIENATGEYTILMDSDDYFLDGWYEILTQTILKAKEDYKDVNSFVFGTILVKNEKSHTNLPPENTLTNFIALRADLNIKKDLKEVVKTDILKSCLYEVSDGIRRVPTSLLWSKVAEKTDCLCISKPIALKEYLPGGMTAKNLELKSENPAPLLELYELLSNSNKYKSLRYRFRSMLLWGRYANHAKNINFNYVWQYLVYALGFSIFLLDKFRLFQRKFKS